MNFLVISDVNDKFIVPKDKYDTIYFVQEFKPINETLVIEFINSSQPGEYILACFPNSEYNFFVFNVIG